VARGEKAGAINSAAQPIFDSADVFRAWQPLITKPETSWDYEVGVNTNWFDNTFFANINVYWTDLYNFQTGLIDSSYRDSTGQPIRVNYLGNAPHARLRGIELTGRWNPIERLWFNFNGAYTEARWVDFANAPPPADWLWTTAAPPDFAPAPLTLSRSNTRWEALPLWTFNIGVNYEHPLGPVLDDLGPGWEKPFTAFYYVNLAWQDKTQLTDPASVFQFWQPAYSIVNAGIGLRTDDDSLALSVWSKNLFDMRPVYSWSPGDPNNPATFGLPTRPRIFGATLLVKFD
jgi:iron complex outermembrane receptor protein